MLLSITSSSASISFPVFVFMMRIKLKIIKSKGILNPKIKPKFASAGVGSGGVGSVYPSISTEETEMSGTVLYASLLSRLVVTFWSVEAELVLEGTVIVAFNYKEPGTNVLKVNHYGFPA